MRKPAIPDVPTRLPSDQQAFLAVVKERLEIISGDRRSAVAPLDPEASSVDIALKINELISLLQD